MNLIELVILAGAMTLAVAVGVFFALTINNKKQQKGNENIRLRFMDEAVRIIREKATEASREAFQGWKADREVWLNENSESQTINTSPMRFMFSTEAQLLLVVERLKRAFDHQMETERRLLEEEEESQEVLGQAHAHRESAKTLDLEARNRLSDARANLELSEKRVRDAQAEARNLLSQAQLEANSIMEKASNKAAELIASMQKLLPMAREFAESGNKESPGPVQRKTDPQLPVVEKSADFEKLISAGSGVHGFARLKELAESARPPAEQLAETEKAQWEREKTNPSGVKAPPTEPPSNEGWIESGDFNAIFDQLGVAGEVRLSDTSEQAVGSKPSLRVVK